MAFTVLLTAQAQDDLLRLFDFIVERELARDGDDLAIAQRALDGIRQGLKLLEKFPFTCRKAHDSAFLRELVIPYGNTGYVALFEIADARTVVVAAVRHQREDDYY